MIPKILQKSRKKIAAICQKYGVQELALFGSRAKGLSNKESDFDFLVEFQPNTEIGLIKFLKMQSELEQIVKQQVDLVSKKGLKPTIRKQVLKETEIVYAK